MEFITHHNRLKLMEVIVIGLSTLEMICPLCATGELFSLIYKNINILEKQRFMCPSCPNPYVT